MTILYTFSLAWSRKKYREIKDFTIDIFDFVIYNYHTIKETEVINMTDMETAALERMGKIISKLGHIEILQLLSYGEGLAAKESREEVKEAS